MKVRGSGFDPRLREFRMTDAGFGSPIVSRVRIQS